MINLLHPRFRTLLAAFLLGWIGFTLPVQAVPTYPDDTAFASGMVNGGKDPGLPYRYVLPAGYSLPANAGVTYPLVIFLHGATEMGNSNSAQLSNDANGAKIFVSTANPNNQQDNPCIFVAPNCGGAEVTEGDWHWLSPVTQLGALIRGFVKNYRVDPDRVYVTGLSHGGNGTWIVQDFYPELIAAAVPICGYQNDWSADAFRRMVARKINIWGFCRTTDPTVGEDNMETPMTLLWAQKGRARYTRYDGNSHDSWNPTYRNNNTRLIPWMMAQRRNQWSTSGDPATVSLTSATVSGSTVNLAGTTTDVNAGLTSVRVRTALSSATTTFPEKSKQVVNATGIASWTANSVGLNSGLNSLQVLGVGPSLSASVTGNTYYPLVFDVSTLGAVDTTAPSVTISVPSGATSTSARTIGMSGASSDASGIASVLWFNDRGGNGKVIGTTSWTVNTIYLYPGNNVISVVAQDNAGNYNSTSVTVNCTGTDTNQAPRVDTGADMVCNTTGGNYLQARAEDDDLPTFGQALTYTWTLVSSPAGSTYRISGANVRRAYVDLFTVAGDYVFRCTVSDGSALSSSDTVKITYNPGAGGTQPCLNAGVDGTVYLQGDTVLAGLEAIRWPVAAPVTWSFVSGPSTPTIVHPKNDDYAAITTPGTYMFRATCTSGGQTITDDVTVTVVRTTPSTPTNQPPTVNAGIDQVITLPSTASLAGTVSDDGLAPGNPTPTVTWTKVSPAGSTVTFGTPNAVNTTATFSAAGTYVLRLTANDGVLSTSDDITVTVNAAGGGGSGLKVLFDFGNTPTSGNWNNVSTTGTGVKISNAVDETGTTTGIGLNVTAAFDNITGAGYALSGGAYPATATQDSFYMQSWVGHDVTGKVKLTGLNPSQLYDLTFFASRMTGGVNRVTEYKIGSKIATLDATDNSNYTISISDVLPAGDGTIEVEVRNNIGNGYGYLGVLELEIPANQPPVVNAGSDQTITLPSTASLSGTVSDDGKAPGNPTPTVTWTKVSPAGSTVTFGTPNAVNTTATFSAAGTYVLRLTANDGVLSTSDDVTVTVNAAPNSVLFDFGATTTSGNWNNVTTTGVGNKISNAVNSTGATTGIGLDVTAAFATTATGGGSINPSGIYPPNAMVDSFYLQSWAGNDLVGKVKLTGLNPSTSYTLKFFASKMASGSRVAQYKVGASTVTLDALDNETTAVPLPNLTPAPDGTIEVEVKSPTSNGYFHLGVMEVVW
jgi:poly(3-hydroxybutyrate) depolymerase/predicted secreted protein